MSTPPDWGEVSVRTHTGQMFLQACGSRHYLECVDAILGVAHDGVHLQSASYTREQGEGGEETLWTSVLPIRHGEGGLLSQGS